MNRAEKKTGPGFTLLELIVVVALLGMVFAVTLPRFDRIFEVGPTDKVINHLTAKAAALRETAIATQKARYIGIDFSNKKIATMDQPLDPDNPELGDKAGFEIPESVEIVDMEFPDGRTQSSGVAQIRVSPKGYLQYVALHLEDEDQKRVTLFFEPFLGKVRVVEGHENMEQK